MSWPDEALDVHEQVTLVVHDWGSALGFDWANRHPEAVKGIAYMEAIARPQNWDHWDNLGPGLRPVLEALRSNAGEAMVLQDNLFVVRVLPYGVLRTLSAGESALYFDAWRAFLCRHFAGFGRYVLEFLSSPGAALAGC